MKDAQVLARPGPATNLEAGLPPSSPNNYVTELWQAIIKSIPVGISSTNNNWNDHNLIDNEYPRIYRRIMKPTPELLHIQSRGESYHHYYLYTDCGTVGC